MRAWYVCMSCGHRWSAEDDGGYCAYPNRRGVHEVYPAQDTEEEAPRFFREVRVAARVSLRVLADMAGLEIVRYGEIECGVGDPPTNKELRGVTSALSAAIRDQRDHACFMAGGWRRKAKKSYLYCGSYAYKDPTK